MNAKTKGLGRGLGAIFEIEGSALPEKTKRSAFEEIEIDRIAPNPKQPRTHFGEQALDELAESIRTLGVIQPITVRKEADGRYTIISGERRWRASKLAGLTSMPAYIREADEESMLAMAIVENIQRQDLNAIEVALSLQRLVDECHLTQDSLGERVGKKRSTVANYLRLLKLPVEVQLAVREELISMGHARALINLESEQQQIALLKKTIKKGLSVRQVEEAVKDPAVKGMWCVPKYSNPDGIVYSDETIARIAALKPAAPDFALMWDNAYCIHEFDGEFVPFRDILTLCREAGNDGMVYEFASTSKVTLPGAGFSVMATSEANQAYLQKLIGIQTISYDKVNSLRHVRFLKDKAHTLELMKKHAAILNPKFQCVLRHLDTEIAPLGIATWQRAKGGYFVSVNTEPGLAKRTLALCKEAGVVMTGAGATFSYGIDPQDSNIRIAPSLPPVHELEQAMEIFCTSLKLAALEKLLA